MISFKPLIAASFTLLSLCMTAPSAQARTMEDKDVVVLRTIDKLSARAHTFDIPVGKTVKFGKSLFIKVRACRKSSPLDEPEDASFLQIWERAPRDEEATWVFSGWMFSSNPALSAMDHGVYDVWVIDCKNASTAVKSQEFSSETVPETAPEDATPAPAASVTPSGIELEDLPVTAPAPDEKSEDDNRTAEPMPALEDLPGSFDSGAE